MACDLVVADRGAVFSLPEVGSGFVAASGATVRLPAWVPLPVALELLLLGRRFTAVEAQTWGLVNRVVPGGHSLPEALEMAAVIGRQAPLAVQATKRLVAGIVDGEFATEHDAWERTVVEATASRATEDAQEGPAHSRRRDLRCTGGGDSAERPTTLLSEDNSVVSLEAAL